MIDIRLKAGHFIMPILLFTFLSFLSGNALAFSYTLELSEDKLQGKAEAMMPLEKKKFFITTTLTNPIISLLEESNEIGLTTDVQVKAPGKLSGNGRVSFTGSIRYDSDLGSFFFDHLNLTSLQVDQIPADKMLKIKDLLQTVAVKFLSIKPVFSFKDDNLKHKLAKVALKSVSVKGNVLEVELSVF